MSERRLVDPLGLLLQASRIDPVLNKAVRQVQVEVLAIEDLCDRHDITVEGIVALVDEVFTDVPYDEASFVSQRGLRSANYLRRLTRREEV